MQNKKQIRLKTILATNWIQPKQNIKNEIKQYQSSPSRQKIKSQTSRRLQSAKKVRYQTQQHQPVQASFKRLVVQNILNEKAALKMFPKRQSAIKNGNPYRYYLTYSRKIMTQQPEQQQLNSKFGNAVSKGSISLQKGQISTRRYTEACHVKHRIKSMKTSQTSRVKDSNLPSPWFLKQDFDFDPQF